MTKILMYRREAAVFGFLKKAGKVSRLEKIVQELEMNMSNNYKDAAQENFREFEQALNELEAVGGNVRITACRGRGYLLEETI